MYELSCPNLVIKRKTIVNQEFAQYYKMCTDKIITVRIFNLKIFKVSNEQKGLLLYTKPICQMCSQ